MGRFVVGDIIMIKINNFQTHNLVFPDGILLKWTIEDTTEDLSNYVFEIYRTSYATSSDKNVIEGNLRNRYIANEDDVDYIAEIDSGLYEFLDDTSNPYKNSLSFLYEIYSINKITNEVSTPTSLVYLFNDWNKKDLIGGLNYVGYIREIQKKYLQVINNKIGYILQAKRFGEHCPYCWDDIRQQTSKYDCPCCLGTGYRGGYHRPYEVKFNYLTPVRVFSENPRLEGVASREEGITVWIESYPLVFEGDIFINEKNDRYKVNSVTQTTKNNEHILRQQLTMTKLARSDVCYEFGINENEVIKYDF